MTNDERNPERDTYDISEADRELLRQSTLAESGSVLAEVERPAVFEESMTLRLEVQGATSPIRLSPHEKELILGRRDPVVGETPDIDLTPYGAYQMGLSRRHAAIRLVQNRLVIWDLGSKNGTYVNAQKLAAMQPHPLRSGDEIRLGKMVIHIAYE